MTHENQTRITYVAPTIAALLGVEKPAASGEASEAILTLAREALGGQADRVVMYNPDAVALYLYQQHTNLYMGVLRHSQMALPVLSVMPSVTPVCFASMYTGAMPEVHGIRKYEKPVLRTDTIFDACLRAGKRVAIVAEENCSMSRIFLERPMDYFIYPTVDEVNQKAEELLRADEYDLLVIYNGNYDSTMHRHSPEAPESLAALQANCETYARIAELLEENRAGHRTALAFAPDHGCHEIDGGLGSHGLEMEEDMNILHFWRFLR